ncbi:MAG: hypothetical protein JO041_00585 [Acidobacteria bacterium]|nr:hypothetical protein [Acidobacteriota bacterium]
MRLVFPLLLLLGPGAALRASAQQKAAAQNTTRSPHGPLNIPCQNCHTFTGWKPIRRAPEFDHNTTKYPLRGLHKNVACTECHVSMVFSNVGTKCADCHADIHHRQMGAQCEQCHTVNGWMVSINAIQQHQNRFPLLGAHATVDCEDCHKGAAVGQFQGLSTACISCHQKDFSSVTVPNHVALNFSPQCQTCHTTLDSWLGAKFDHSLTGFPLTGAHATLACTDCHIGGKFQGTPAQCIACHTADFSGATNPNHVALGFPQTCQQCHSTTTWLGAVFDHSTTGFPLTGAHVTVPCSACHTSGAVLTSANAQCVTCHLADYQGTTSPSHTAVGFPTTCNSCHTTVNWLGATFDHSTTGFPLTGAHASLACSACHSSTSTLTAANTQCASCHMPDYQGTTNPSHAAVGFPTTCASCHTTTTWLGATFDHSTTGFTLTGAHVSLACTACHTSAAILTAANAQCSSCHMTDYQQTTNPSHVAVAFPTTCSQCHTTTNWLGATFDHSTTGFTLTGFHLTLACSSCHSGTALTAANATCAACHMKDYQGTTNPNHAAVGFPTDCSVCHSTTDWTGATFNHATTGFPLTGAHTSLACTACHSSGATLTSANTTCVSCHLKDFQGTTNPNHVTSGFPQQCDLCHSTTAWSPSTFNHNNTVFPLTGAHVNVACASCHVNGNYTTTPTDCYSCHKTDYSGTTNPNHVAAGFPTTCATCHTTTAWTGATFNHTWFPIPHHSATLCSDCHTNASDYTVFLCTQCHTQGPTTQQHSGVKGFVWNSANCYACHKNGGGG